jgi:hypothetical protein
VGNATHLGPWLIGTVKNTTGTTAGKVRNVGATVAAQTATVNYFNPANTIAFAIPAGAMITQVQVTTTVAYNSATTIVCSINGTPINSALTITFAGTNVVLTYIASAAVITLLGNVGTTDALFTYTLTGTALTTGISYLMVTYIVRNADGTYAPNSFTGP